MSEAWYRGEGAGVAPSKPGGDLHDLGDGFYLTDTEDVAWQYAKLRAPGYKEYRVFQVSVDRQSLGRVLDLTMDPRWVKFMTDPIVRGSTNPNLTRSRLDFLRVKFELYGQYFRDFLRLNNIDIETYDAVIGPEYVRGGKQLCILHKKGLTTRLSTRIRSLLIPEPWAARLSKVAARWGRVSFPRAAGGFIINVGFNVLIAYLVNVLKQKVDERFMKQQMMEDIEPEIKKYVAASQRIILDNLSSGERAYVTASIETRTVQMPGKHLETRWDDAGVSLPVLQLGSLGITARDWSGSNPKRRVETPRSGLIIYITELTFSTEANVPEDDVKIYSDVQRQLKWYETALKNSSLTDSDRAKLKKDREALWDWIDQTYGKLDDFTPSPANWTDDGYAGISGSSK